MTTAAEKLMMLRLPAVLRLLVTHLQIRAAREVMDPDALERAAHELNDIATAMRRRSM